MLPEVAEAMECPGEEIVAAGKLPLAAYFGHSYFVIGASESSFFAVEHRYICENPLINALPESISSKVE